VPDEASGVDPTVPQEAALRIARADIVGRGADRLDFFGS
jgi:hypothetical protein